MTKTLGQQGVGQYLAILAVVVVMAASVALGYLGHGTAAGTVGGLTVVGIVSAFIYGRREQAQNESSQ